MKCIVCDNHIPVWREQNRNIIPYCSQNCRTKYYHDKKTVKEIRLAIRNNDLESLLKFTIKRLKKLGFYVLIRELTITNQEVK